MTEKTHSSLALSSHRLVHTAGIEYLVGDLKNDPPAKPDSISYYPSLEPYV